MTALPAPDRRLAERRVSPAVGQFAIEECARLREVNAELLAALQEVMMLLREEASKDDPMEPFAYDKRWEDCAIAADAAIAKAQP